MAINVRLSERFRTAEAVRNGKVLRDEVRRLAVLGVATAEIIDEHLFDWLVVSHEDMADGASADKVADFFSEVLGMIAGALERLRHKDDLQASLADDIFRILDVAQEDKVAEAVHFGVGAENDQGAADVAFGKRCAAVGEHFF